MASVPLHRQFLGQARLVRLLLWRIGGSTEVNEGLRAACASGMITEDDDAFLRDCLAAEEDERTKGDLPAGFVIDEELLSRLRRCADRMNRADSA